MKYKKISLNELQTQFPDNTQIKISKQNAEVQNEYMELYNVYRDLFTQYIIKNLNLKEYDKKLSENKLEFIPEKEEKMDIYQYFSSSELKYFYVRNNIYLDHLSKNDLKILKAKSQNKDILLDEEATKFIESTYKKVIKEGTKTDKEEYNVSFGPSGSYYSAKNDAVVIGVRYDTFEQAGMNDDEWFDRYCEREEYLKEIVEELQEKSKGKINSDVAVFEYTDGSIIMKNQPQKKKDDQEEER